MESASPVVEMTVPLEMDYLGLATSFVEQAGEALGLGKLEALKLTLAAEEVFSFLAGVAEHGESLRLRLRGLGYQVRADFHFPRRDMDLRYLNLVAEHSVEEETHLDQLGLLIASRSVERLFLQEAGGEFLLSLSKEKGYPEPLAVEPIRTEQLDDYRLQAPGPGQIKELSRLIAAHYPAHLFPSSFAAPGKLVDMIAGGEYAAAAAVGPRQQLGGVMLWRLAGGGNVRCYGPYLFGQPAGSPMAADLVEACLGRIAKSDAMNLVCRYPSPELPREYFELLGSLDYRLADGGALPWPHYYRQLHEDPGGRVWSHPDMEDFLRRTYARLFLAREVRPTRPEGEGRPAHSVFGAHFDRSQGHVSLSYLWDGLDATDNLARHLKALTEEEVPNIFFTLDLGQAWQTHLTPALLASGFEPRLVLPLGGRGDVVVLQHTGGRP